MMGAEKLMLGGAFWKLGRGGNPGLGWIAVDGEGTPGGGAAPGAPVTIGINTVR